MDRFSNDHLKKNLKKKAVRGAGTRLVSQAILFSVRFTSGVTLARLLGVDDFGLVTMVAAISMILLNVGAVGLGDATVQSDEITHERVSCLFWINFVVSAAVMLLFAAVSPIVAWFYGEPKLQPIAVGISLSFFFRGTSTQHLALLRRNMEFGKLSLNEIVAVVVSDVTAVVLALTGWGYWSLVARRVLSHFAANVGAWILCDWRPGFYGMTESVKPLLHFGVNNSGSQLLYGLWKNLDKILLGWKYNAYSLGAYNQGFQLFVMPFNQMVHPLGAVFVSTLSRLRDEEARYRRYYLRGISVLAFVGMGIGAVSTLMGEDLIVFVLGEKWRDAGPIFCGFAPGIGMMLVVSTHGWIHQSLGRADRLLRWSFVVVVVRIVLLLAGLPFGPLGVAIAFSGSFYLLLIPGSSYAGKTVGLTGMLVLATIWRYLLAAVISCGGLWYIFYVQFGVAVYDDCGMTSWLLLGSRLLLGSVLCLALYVGLVIALFRSTEPVTSVLSLVGELLPQLRRRRR